MKQARIYANRRAVHDRRLAEQERTRQAHIAASLLSDITGGDFTNRYWLGADVAIETIRAYLATNPLTQEQSHLWLSNIDAVIRREMEGVA